MRVDRGFDELPDHRNVVVEFVLFGGQKQTGQAQQVALLSVVNITLFFGIGLDSLGQQGASDMRC